MTPQAPSTPPANLPPEIAYLVEKARRLDNGQMTGEQLLNLLVADEHSAQILAAGPQQNQRDEINAEGAEGTVVSSTGTLNQYFFNGSIDAVGLLNLIRPPTAAPAAPPSSAPQNRTVEEYRQQIHAVCTPPPKYHFPLSFHFVMATGAPIEPATSIPIDQLIQRIDLLKPTLLRGSAGSGKSTAVRLLVEQLTRDAQTSIIPIYLELRGLKPDDAASLNQSLAEEVEPELYIEPLLTCSPILISTDLIKQLGDWVASVNGGRILVIADGLNEVYGENVASAILKRLTLYATKRSLTTRILVTDRTTPRDALTAQWAVARLEQLTAEVVRQQFQVKGIEGIYNDLGESDRTLLRTPYFLEYALDHNTARLSSPTEAIAGFFKRLNPDDNALDRLSKAAYAAYADHHSYRFDVAHFSDIVGLDTFSALEDEGVITRIASDQPAGAPAGDQHAVADQVQFDHPLKHDYLAAKYLSQHDDEWNPMALDALSFESNSFDALSMTLELLRDEEHADHFVERVHSWNWAAAFVCIAKAMRYGSGRHSQEMQMAVLALVVEKLFDPVQQTRDRARGVLALFKPDIAAPYEQVGDLKALCALVQQQVAAEGKLGSELWFPRWRDLFVRFDNPTFSELDLKNIVDTKSIIGWTAANVFKRFKLSDIDVRQLCAYYDACNACGQDDWLAGMIRWRVVHALGATDTQPVKDLLIGVLSQDPYLWARIGAARSLVEIAALTANDDLRQAVITTLIDAVDHADERTLVAKTLHEIGQSAFYRDAHGDWEQAVTPLIEMVCKRVSASEQDWWSDLLARFKDFCQEQARRQAPAASNGSASPMPMPAVSQPASG